MESVWTRALARLALCVGVSIVPSCVEDSDNVSWYIVSSPSFDGEPVQGGLIVSWRSSSKSTGVLRFGNGGSFGGAFAGSPNDGNPEGRPAVYFLEESGGPDGRDPAAERDILLGIDSDFAVVSTPTETTLYSRALPGGRVTIAGLVGLDPVPDPATALRVTTSGPDRTAYLFAAGGDLVWEVGRSGLVAYLPAGVPQRFPEGSRLEATESGYRVVESTRVTIVPTPPGIRPGSQYEVVEAGDTVRFFDAQGGIAAQLPNRELVRQSGDEGTILRGDFPQGAGNFDDPFRAVLLRSNRRLLLIRGQ